MENKNKSITNMAQTHNFFWLLKDRVVISSGIEFKISLKHKPAGIETDKLNDSDCWWLFGLPYSASHSDDLSAIMGNFEFPWQYNFPPFFT